MTGSGADVRDFLGDGMIRTIFPNGEGLATDWTPTPTTPNWEQVNDQPAPDGDTTYVTASTPGARDVYQFQDIPAGSIVKAAQLVILAQKADEGTVTLAPIVGQGGVQYDGVTQGVASTSYDHYLTQPYDRNPATGVAWTDTEINAGHWGVLKRPDQWLTRTRNFAVSSVAAAPSPATSGHDPHRQRRARGALPDAALQRDGLADGRAAGSDDRRDRAGHGPQYRHPDDHAGAGEQRARGDRGRRPDRGDHHQADDRRARRRGGHDAHDHGRLRHRQRGDHGGAEDLRLLSLHRHDHAARGCSRSMRA